MRNIFKKKQNPKNQKHDYYEDLEISLFKWSKYIELNDVNWLRKDYTGREPKIDNEEIRAVETKLNDEYFELVNDDKYRELLEKRLKVAKLITRYVKIVSICDRVHTGFETDNQKTRLEYIMLLEKEGFKIPKINSINGDIEEVEKVVYACEQIKNQINILSKDLEQKSSQVKTSVEKQLIYLCLGLEMKIMRPKEISVIQFVELNNILKEKNEALRESQQKNKSSSE